MARVRKLPKAELRDACGTGARLVVGEIVDRTVLSLERCGSPFPGSREDLVDCVANANALGLFAALKLSRVRGCAEAEEMLKAAITWAGNDRERAASLSPFYPDPAELVLALAHAVAQGAKRIVPIYAAAAATPWERTPQSGSVAPTIRYARAPTGTPCGAPRLSQRCVAGEDARRSLPA
jgi:hypothetical protein